MPFSATQYLDMFAPQFTAVASKDMWLQWAAESLSPCFFGAKYAEATALKAAHGMTLCITRGGGDAGAISSKKEGQLAVSYQPVSLGPGYEDLSQTSYGLSLKNMMLTLGGGVSVTSPGAPMDSSILGTPGNPNAC